MGLSDYRPRTMFLNTGLFCYALVLTAEHSILCVILNLHVLGNYI